MTPAHVWASGPQLTGNMEVSVTMLPWLKNKRVKEFPNLETMTEAILASSCVFPMPPIWLKSLNSWGMDGAYSDFQILKVRRTQGLRSRTMRQGGSFSQAPWKTAISLLQCHHSEEWRMGTCFTQGVFLGRSFFTLHRLEDAIAVSPFYMSRADIK